MNASHITAAYSRLCTGLHQEINPDELAIWKDVLCDLPDDALILAVDEWLRRDTHWMPRPGELRAIAVHIKHDLHPTLSEDAHWRRDHYECSICRDTGFVTIWHQTAVTIALAFAAGEIQSREQRAAWATAAAKCTCAAGEKKGGHAAVYRCDRDLLVDTTQSITKQKESLDEWARSQIAPAAA